jgi:hypothetical protein
VDGTVIWYDHLLGPNGGGKKANDEKYMHLDMNLEGGEWRVAQKLMSHVGLISWRCLVKESLPLFSTFHLISNKAIEYYCIF